MHNRYAEALDALRPVGSRPLFSEIAAGEIAAGDSGFAYHMSRFLMAENTAATEKTQAKSIGLISAVLSAISGLG
jgi:hypothetical protein